MDIPRVHINSCSMPELLLACNGDRDTAAKLMKLRQMFGNLTPDLVAILPHVGSSLVGEFNYEPYDTDRDIPNPGQGDYAPPSATPVSSLPGSTPLFTTPRTGQGSSHTSQSQPTYHYDGYPPSPPSAPNMQENVYRSPRSRGAYSRPSPTSYHPDSRAYPYRQSSTRWSPGAYRPPDRTPAHSLRYRSIPKSMTFNGSGSWQAFYSKFKAFADQVAWSCAQRKNELHWCLEGHASVFFSNLLDREPLLEFDELVARLENRYGCIVPPQAVQMQLASARQGKEEHIRDWADRVLDMATRAFPECLEHQVQGQAVLYFCQGCYDREAGAHALNLRAQTVEEAMELVTWRKCSYQVVYSRTRREANSAIPGRNPVPYREAEVRRVEFPQQTRTPPSGQVSPKPPSPTGAESDPTTSAQLYDSERRLGGLEKQIAGLQTSMDKVTAALSSMPARGRSPSPSPGGAKQDCYSGRQPSNYKKEYSASTATQNVSKVQQEEESNSSGSEEVASLWPGYYPATDLM